MTKSLLIDIMVDGTFYTQIYYTRHGHPELVDGEIVEVHRKSDIEDYVHEKLPSLKHKKNVQIEFASQKVFTI